MRQISPTCEHLWAHHASSTDVTQTLSTWDDAKWPMLQNAPIGGAYESISELCGPP